MVEKENIGIDFLVAMYWFFWRICLYVPFFVQLHLLIKYKAIPPIPFLIRALIFLPYYIFIENGLAFIKRNEGILIKDAEKSKGFTGTTVAVLAAVLGAALNHLLLRNTGASESFLNFYGLIWAAVGVHISNVIKIIRLRNQE